MARHAKSAGAVGIISELVWGVINGNRHGAGERREILACPAHFPTLPALKLGTTATLLADGRDIGRFRQTLERENAQKYMRKRTLTID